MRFAPLPRVYADIPTYGATKGSLTFVISEDSNGFTASVKVVGARPFDGSRKDLGGYAAHKTFTAAAEACKKFYRNRDA